VRLSSAARAAGPVAATRSQVTCGTYTVTLTNSIFKSLINELLCFYGNFALCFWLWSVKMRIRGRR
jgi:hypothetical protein